MSPREYLTRWHVFFGDVTEATVVVEIRYASSVLHQCRRKDGDPKVAAEPRPKPIRIDMFQPFDYANAAGYCAGCDTLYVDTSVCEKQAPIKELA